MRLITVILKTDGFKIVRYGNNTLYLNCRHCVLDSVVNLSDHSVYPSFYLLVYGDKGLNDIFLFKPLNYKTLFVLLSQSHTPKEIGHSVRGHTFNERCY